MTAGGSSRSRKSRFGAWAATTSAAGCWACIWLVPLKRRTAVIPLAARRRPARRFPSPAAVIMIVSPRPARHHRELNRPYAAPPSPDPVKFGSGFRNEPAVATGKLRARLKRDASRSQNPRRVAHANSLAQSTGRVQKILAKKILAKNPPVGTRPSPTQGHDDPDKFTELPLRTAVAVLLRMASSGPLPSSASCRRRWPRAWAPTSSGCWPQ